MTACIVCRDLVFKRGGTVFLQAGGFELAAGSVTGLLGHNGAGKSTLIKLILGLLKPASGTLTVLGGRPGADPRRVGYLPENANFYDAMTVLEHLQYFARLKGAGRSRVDELVAQLGLAAVAGRRLGVCSKGERQRLGLAQALLSRPAVLLLDEPTVGLDPAASGAMYDELARLRGEGCCIVVCTHELALAEPRLDSAILLAGGRMQGFGTLDALRLRAGLPVRITGADEAVVQGDATLARYAAGGALSVPPSQAQAVLRRLTQEHGCYDLQVAKASLAAIFEHYVTRAAAQEEGAP
ncbi:MAG: ABC transporter ATP-binding protein [Duodenibacillus sp.]|nr:ABC transporter ATP-binding protein [Duodenibacillus sp.]